MITQKFSFNDLDFYNLFHLITIVFLEYNGGLMKKRMIFSFLFSLLLSLSLISQHVFALQKEPGQRQNGTISLPVYLPLVLNDYPGDPPAWQQVSSPTTQYLLDIYMLDPNSGWIVGNQGTILTWDGSIWESITPLTTENLYAVCATSESNVWAVGNGGTIIHYDGAAWSIFDSTGLTNQNLRDIRCISETSAWIVGYSGIVLRWDGNAWAVDDSFLFTDNLEGMAYISENDVWAFGGSYNHPAVFRFNGSEWNPVDILLSPGESVDFSFAGDFSNSNNGWIVGGSKNILFWNGSSLGEYSLDPEMILTNDVDILTENNGWIVGLGLTGSNIRHWNSNTWEDVSSPTNQNLEAIFMLGENLGWAVGENGVIIKYSR